MYPNSNFRDLLRTFNECGVRYIVAGGYARMFHTEPHYTKDLDVWVETTPENAELVYRALIQFGAPLRGITAADFAQSEGFYQLGRPPQRIDVMLRAAGISFAECWDRRVQGAFGELTVPYLSLDDLIANKQAAGRLQDLADAERLEEERERRRKGGVRWFEKS